MTTSLLRRPRRNRKSAAIRSLVQETNLHPHDFVAPLFVIEGEGSIEEIKGLKGVFRRTIDQLLKECHALDECGIQSIILFPAIHPSLKDANGSYALQRDNLIHRAISSIKSRFPDMAVMVDVALDPYTTHGHDGLINDQLEVDNDDTVEVLKEMACLLAEAGADVVAPSDMMDGRVKAIRQALDEENFSQVSILAYTAKYASNFYGPFREAVGTANLIGDKKGYQMNPANVKEALLEAKLDVEEGADLLLIKPALPYLDVIAKIKAETLLPIGAYQVSGEYAQLVAAAEVGALNFEKALMETLTSIKRAGADFIISYGAKEAVLLIE
jgi:porphobilinogen synthase